MNTKNESIRLNSESPLVLKVGAMTDFLWPSFVREAKPRVTYLADRFQIDRLSRFGKELFEFFYMGGQVEPVVTLEAAENYFRAKQNGEQVDYPKGYKPENALWHLVLNDVVDSPMYELIQKHCTGDHFNSGNNAVNVLNELSEVIENALIDNSNLWNDIAEREQELKDIRDNFVSAMKKGDAETAAELKVQGKIKGSELEDMLMDIHQGKKAKIELGIERAYEETIEQEESISKIAGDSDGFGMKVDDVDAKIKLANKIKNNSDLKEFIKRLGALKAAWTKRKRERKVKSNYANVVGAKLSNEVIKAFPSELALASTKEGRSLFVLKYSEKTMLCKEFESNTKDVKQGSVIMYVDISGSMMGEDELWSKAITYCIIEECIENKRDVYVRLFNNHIENNIELKSDNKDNSELLDFIMQWRTCGGTSFDSVMRDAMWDTHMKTDKADILILTDGECEVDKNVLKEFGKFKHHKSIDVRGFCIGKKSKNMEQFCDEVVLVNTEKDIETSEIFQTAIE